MVYCCRSYFSVQHFLHFLLLIVFFFFILSLRHLFARIMYNSSIEIMIRIFRAMLSDESGLRFAPIAIV